MSSGSHSVSSSPFSFHIKERHNALPAHLTLKLSSSTELILTGKLMSPAGNSLLLQIFFFFSGACPQGALIGKTNFCSELVRLDYSQDPPREERQEEKAGSRGTRPILVTWSCVRIIQRFETRFQITGEATVQCRQATDCLISWTIFSIFTEAAAPAEKSASKTAARRS